MRLTLCAHVFTPTFSHIFRTTEDPAFNEKISPLFHIDSIEKPLLIGQGANDPRVKQAEADQIAFAMKEKEIPVEYVLTLTKGTGSPGRSIELTSTLEPKRSSPSTSAGGLSRPLRRANPRPSSRS